MNSVPATSPPFIVFEGVDFTGKSTLSRRLTQRFLDNSIDAIWYRSPGGSPRGEELREICRNGDLTPLEQTRVFLEALEATVTYIEEQPPHIAILDRFTLSTAFYQLKELQKLNYGSVEYHEFCGSIATLNHRLSKNRKKPLLLVLDISEKTFEERKAVEKLKPTDGRTKDRFENMSYQQQHAIRSYYHNARHEPWTQGYHLVMVDANQPVDQVYADVVVAVEAYLT